MEENPSKRIKTGGQKTNYYFLISTGFPPSFIQFLKENDIDPKVYNNVDNLPRYVR